MNESVCRGKQDNEQSNQRRGNNARTHAQVTFGKRTPRPLYTHTTMVTTTPTTTTNTIHTINRNPQSHPPVPVTTTTVRMRMGRGILGLVAVWMCLYLLVLHPLNQDALEMVGTTTTRRILGRFACVVVLVVVERVLISLSDYLSLFLSFVPLEFFHDESRLVGDDFPYTLSRTPADTTTMIFARRFSRLYSLLDFSYTLHTCADDTTTLILFFLLLLLLLLLAHSSIGSHGNYRHSSWHSTLAPLCGMSHGRRQQDGRSHPQDWWWWFDNKNHSPFHAPNPSSLDSHLLFVAMILCGASPTTNLPQTLAAAFYVASLLTWYPSTGGPEWIVVDGPQQFLVPKHHDDNHKTTTRSSLRIHGTLGMTIVFSILLLYDRRWQVQRWPLPPLLRSTMGWTLGVVLDMSRLLLLL